MKIFEVNMGLLWVLLAYLGANAFGQESKYTTKSNIPYCYEVAIKPAIPLVLKEIHGILAEQNR
jgi:hypothetical protein